MTVKAGSGFLSTLVLLLVYNENSSVAGCGVYGGVTHRDMALPPGVEEASCILAAHSRRSWILQAGNAVHHLR